MVGLNRESYLNALFWTFSSWQVFSEASSPVPELFSLACGSGAPPPPSISQEGFRWRAHSPSLFDMLASMPEVYSVYPSSTSLATFFSLLIEIWSLDQWVWGGENISFFLSSSPTYSHVPSLLKCPHPTKAWDEDFKHTPEGATRLSLTRPSA